MIETVPAEVVVGVDTHKHAHTAAAIDARGARLGALTVPVGVEGYRELEAWAHLYLPSLPCPLGRGEAGGGREPVARWGARARE